MKKLIKELWNDPDGPFKDRGKKMAALWNDPDGPFKDHGKKMAALWSDSNSNYRNMVADKDSKWRKAMRKKPCTKCGQMIDPTNYGKNFELCQGKITLSDNDSIKYIFDKSPEKANDVIMASGTQTRYKLWKGNVFFNSLLIRTFSNSPSPSANEKKKIITTIMDQIEKNDGRFVKYIVNQKIWEVLPEKNVRVIIGRRYKAFVASNALSISK